MIWNQIGVGIKGFKNGKRCLLWSLWISQALIKMLIMSIIAGKTLNMYRSEFVMVYVIFCYIKRLAIFMLCYLIIVFENFYINLLYNIKNACKQIIIIANINYKHKL